MRKCNSLGIDPPMLSAYVRERRRTHLIGSDTKSEAHALFCSYLRWFWHTVERKLRNAQSACKWAKVSTEYKLAILCKEPRAARYKTTRVVYQKCNTLRSAMLKCQIVVYGGIQEKRQSSTATGFLIAFPSCSDIVQSQIDRLRRIPYL